ncbi:ATP-binding protein [Gammaproteobacteria bacterium]|nr:ATP-binding protein [Gammaproteobacteria bacterium]MDC1423297.1 ATP-binding protein [Gammaproteobacteria bacterium]MDC1511553.1 ATP-binding protein [Gammaproteobacteria bacterium]
MSPTNKERIKWRPTLLQISTAICVIFSLLVAMLMVLFVIPQQISIVETRLDNAARQSLVRLGPSVADPILTRQYEFLYDRLNKQIENDDTWVRLQVLDATGQQIYPLGEWDTVLTPNQHIVFADIGSAPNLIGRLVLVVDHEFAIGESLRLTFILTAALFLIIALTLISVVLFLQAAISRPVIGLTSAFKLMAKGDFDYALPQARSREISYLVQEFSRFRRRTFGYQASLIQLKEDAEQANEAKSRFMSRMSHELRTPLNSVLGFSELALNESKLAPEQRRQLEAIHQSGLHLLDLVNEILDLSRLESDTLEVTLEPVYLPDILDQCHLMTTPFAASHKVSLTVLPIDPNVCCVLADPLRLKQVLINLLSNAIKYNQDNGRVYVEVEAGASNTVFIRVRDTGIGFTQQETAQIFVPFERLNKSAATVDGTGIGLSISKRLVELMNGSIDVHSVEGVGSEFSISLRAAEVSASESDKILDAACCKPIHHLNEATETDIELQPDPDLSRAQSDIQPVLATNLHILVAEDNAINQLLFQTQLESLGYRCTLVGDGLEALSALENTQYDLLLTDISMPNLGGLELTKKIRSGESALKEKGVHMPIVACSANAMNDDQVSGIDAGVDAYLTKPFQKAQLADVLYSAFSAKQSA